MARDRLGNELSVGDTVVCNPPYYKGVQLAEIKAMTPKTVSLELSGVDYWYGDNIIRNSHDVILFKKKEV